MTEGETDTSLAARLGPAARRGAHRFRSWFSRSDANSSATRHDWWVAAALALLLAAGPAATLLGASLLTDSVRAQASALESQAMPRAEREAAGERDRRTLATLVRRPTLGATLEALARALPADASLVRAGRDAKGLLEVEIATPDPDTLRAALRREPLLAGLRDTGQRRGDALMIVSLREASQ